jgi:hypothetical protein
MMSLMLTARGRNKTRSDEGLAWFRAHSQAMLVLSTLLFGGITVLGAGLSGTNAHEVSMLYVLPIGLAAITFGVAGGCMAATFASIVFAGWMAEAGTTGAVGTIGWATRLIAWFLLGALLGDASDRTMRAREEAEVRDYERFRREEAARRHREALELNDTVVQGLAVAKWKVESGDIEGGLQLLGSTMAIVQELVADQMGDVTSQEYRSNLHSLRYGSPPAEAA